MSDVSKTTINLQSDLKKELKKIAIDEDISLSTLIINMIQEVLQSKYNINTVDNPSFDSNINNEYNLDED